jgi:hypothetical protein
MKLNNMIFFTVVLLSFFKGELSYGLDLAKDEDKDFIGIFYVNTLFAQIHVLRNRSSEVLDTLQCQHAVHVYRPKSSDIPPTLVKGGVEDPLTGKPQLLFSDEWEMIKSGSFSGYMLKAHLSAQKVTCLQQQYPQFFDTLELDLTTMTYWGKLKEQLLNISLETP